MAVMTAPPPRSAAAAPDAERPSRAGAGPSAELVATAERLRLASTRLARILRQETHTGLTPTQVAALASLQRSGPVPLGSLAEAERISAPTATKVVDKLVRAGLVERQAHPQDRRVALVTVTAAGHALLAETRRHKTAWLATRLAALDPGDRDRLLDAVEVLEHLVAPEPAEPTEAGDPTATERPGREARS